MDRRSTFERALDRAWRSLEQGDLAAAARALESARAAAPGHADPELAELEAEVALARGDPAATVAALSPVLTGERLRRLGPDEAADLHHALGRAYEELGDRRAMTREWLEVSRLDALADSEARAAGADEAADEVLELDDVEFEHLVDDALGELPADVLERLTNVAIIADDRPSEALVRDGLDPRTLGLFHGLSLPHQSTLGPAYPDTIHLFRRNIERVCHTEAELREEIRVTVLHETAHYIGLDEDDLRRLGLG